MSKYFESYRGVVLASECDLIGHMNIQFYGACVSQAMQTLFGKIGFSSAVIKKNKRGFAAVGQNCRYSGELLAGDIVHMQTAILDYTPKSIICSHRLYNSATDALSYETTLTALHFDMAARKVISFNDEALDLIKALKISEEVSQ